jgi:hypothetical protein
MSKQVCIIYGLNEGPAMGRKLARAFERAGFTMITDAASADIVFAHSGGCFLIPPQNRAQLVILVGVAYWPHRPWLLATFRKVQMEIVLYFTQHRLREWGRKWLYHLRYAFNLQAALRMARNQPLTRSWNSVQPQIIVRNQDDVYCSPDICSAAFRGPRSFVALPGQHDDCWDNPEPYIRLVQSYLSTTILNLETTT